MYGKDRISGEIPGTRVVARVPYQAWESIAYVAMTHTSKHPDFARRIYDRARVARFEQDNEQWHLLILEELTRHERRPWLKGRLIPQLLAVTYYQLSWIMFVLRPNWSYRLNADFEDHAAHEYAVLVEEHLNGKHSRSEVRSRLTLVRTTALPTCSVKFAATRSLTARKASR